MDPNKLTNTKHQLKLTGATNNAPVDCFVVISCAAVLACHRIYVQLKEIQFMLFLLLVELIGQLRTHCV